MKKLSDLRERCWPGYKSVVDKKAYSPGSCVKEDLRKWFDKDHPEGGWKRINSKGEAIGPCAREPGEPKPKCMSNEKRAKLSKKERASAVASKRKHDPNPERKGEPINVSNFGKGKISENMENLEEKNVPTSPEKWAQAKSQAKAKFDVYPSAYANGWAAKKYKEMGGGWKSVSEDVNEQHADVGRFEPVKPHNVKNVANVSPRRTSDSAIVKLKEQSDTFEKNEMAQTQLHFIKYASKEILDYIEMGGEIEEWYQNKLSKVQSEVESLHSYIEGEKRRTGMVAEESEQIDELSKDTLNSYMGKAAKDNLTSLMKPGMIAKKQAAKRFIGMQKAGEKLAKEETLEEGRPSQRHPLEGHDYHKKTDAELIYIAKDAHKAAEAMKSHNTDAENKYRDQANDSATVRYFRQKNGMPEWYKKKYGHIKEGVEQIDEISKTTLGSYVKRASQDAVTKAMDYSSKRDESGKESGTLKKISDRESGIRKATDRLTKEDMEYLDELSKKTLGSYIKKSSDSLDTHSYMAGKSGDDEDYIKSLKRKQGINKATDRLTKEEVDMAEADKHSLIGKMQRGYELKKKVDSTYKDIGIAQKAGNHPEASKAFRKHERYANLERPGTWTKVDEQGVVESSMGHVTIDSPGHRLHGKKANVFHKHEDGRVNVQIRHSNRKGDVTNLTLKPNQFKMNEEVELDEANAMQMASAIESYAKKHGGIDKGDMMKVASMLKKGDMKGAEKYTMRLDSDPRDFLLSKMGFNEATEDIHSHRVGDEIVLKNKNYRGVVKKVSGSDISFENKSDNKHYKATHSMIDRNLSQENRYKEKSDAKNKKFDDAMDSDMKRIHKSGALKKFGIGMNEQMANAPFDPPYSKSTGTHTDKSGAKHGPMSTAKHLARMALAKQARTPAKKTDDRKTSIVREAMADAKKRDAKKKDEKKMDGSNNDKFQADPELTTQKLNNF